jgi:CheY-like chemotaxis protein
MMRGLRQSGTDEASRPDTCPLVLIVNPEPESRQALGLRLEEEGFSVIEAGDAVEGLEKLLDLEPELVLCAMGLPSLDGSWFVQQCRGAGVSASFVMTSATGGPALVEALDNGAVGFLLEPLNVGLVVRALQEVLASKSDGLALEADEPSSAL